jgi:hypothetical protein
MEPQQKKGDGLNALYFLCNIHATCISPFIRSGFGKNALGWNGVLAFTVLWYMACTEKFMGWYFVAWFVVLICRRIQTARILRRGELIHSRYSGYPWLAMKCPFVRTEYTAEVFVEPMGCFFAGALLCPLSPGMGGFVMLGFLSFILRAGIEGMITEKRMEQLQDAMIEQGWYAEELRKRG